jgi:hypothetical protein
VIYTDENMELRAIISDLNQQAIGYVDRIAALEKDVQCWKNLYEFYRQWIIDAGMPISEPPEAI